jgi:hypothetical protein
MKHGARSERRWRPVAEQLRADALQVAPWLTRPAFRWSLEAWSVAEAKARLLDAWLEEHGMLTEDGDVRNAANLADKMHTRAITLRGQLGLDPLSFAKLLVTFAAAPGADDIVAALAAEGRKAMTARSDPPALPVAASDATRGLIG